MKKTYEDKFFLTGTITCLFNPLIYSAIEPIPFYCSPVMFLLLSGGKVTHLDVVGLRVQSFARNSGRVSKKRKQILTWIQRLLTGLRVGNNIKKYRTSDLLGIFRDFMTKVLVGGKIPHIAGWRVQKIHHHQDFFCLVPVITSFKRILIQL
jgi:hypothetical protein